MKTVCILLALVSYIFSGNDTKNQSNKYIYFTTEEGSEGRDIVRISTDGNSRKRLTSDNGSNHYPHHNSPKLSPDGAKIVYHSDTDRHDRYSIWTMNIDGSDKTRITLKEGLFANWSPDGKRIIFSGRRNGIWEILSVASDGSDEKNISENFKKVKQPTWGAVCDYHPNGKSVVFSYIREKKLYSMDLQTKKITQISPSNHSYTQSAFSKYGKQIAVNRKIKEKEGYDLIIISTVDNTIETIAKNVISYSAPSWSKSGEEILFAGVINGNQEIFKINLKDKTETQLTKNSDFDAMPTW
ncbi:uncharacterized protein DUF5050 [Aquimarina sp. MAR_2010_214]|uniref:TolB family protein n=1 Tax=Aquimarina sp. MAR_2010_214 TaxID=1250026 RepID=UPI000C714CFA|nr:DUF5050 domain-containing protein [Aquimarina sp. MAR_2010_214]PKV52568.1 uncharacterized protein DUF5050 [Aquimarina sp. MAR_2010_214]